VPFLRERCNRFLQAAFRPACFQAKLVQEVTDRRPRAVEAFSFVELWHSSSPGSPIAPSAVSPMKETIALLLAFAIGALCGRFAIPLPAPSHWFGVAVIAMIWLGYAAAK
jgi:XapX domain-containing protein